MKRHQKAVDKIIKSKTVSRLISLSQKITFPGSKGVSLYEIARLFIKGLKEGSLAIRASAMAFNFFLAIFPFIIFLFTLIPYIPIENFQERLLGILNNIMPDEVYGMVRSTLEEIVSDENQGLLSFGFISALYFSTNGIVTMMNAFNDTYHDVETRNAIQQRITALLLVLIFSLILIIAIGLLIFSEIVLKAFLNGEGTWSYYAITIGRWLIISALFFCVFSFSYYQGPSRKAQWKFISPGSAVATLLSIITSVGFAFYVDNFAQYNKLYGSIGTLIVILLWINFNSFILLLGFELNASIHMARRKSK